LVTAISGTHGQVRTAIKTAGDEVTVAVGVKVRELRTDADASPIGDFDVFALRLQNDSSIEFRRRRRTTVIEQAVAPDKTADDQIKVAVAVVIDQSGTAVTDQAFAIDVLAIGLQGNRGGKTAFSRFDFQLDGAATNVKLGGGEQEKLRAKH